MLFIIYLSILLYLHFFYLSLRTLYFSALYTELDIRLSRGADRCLASVSDSMTKNLWYLLALQSSTLVVRRQDIVYHTRELTPFLLLICLRYMSDKLYHSNLLDVLYIVNHFVMYEMFVSHYATRSRNVRRLVGCQKHLCGSDLPRIARIH